MNYDERPNPTRINFRGTVFLTTTYSGRLPLLISTLAGVMNLVKYAEFVIRWYDDDVRGLLQAKHVLGMIGRATNNVVTFTECPATHSVARTKVNIGNQTDLRWFVNLDDDLVVSKKSLQMLSLWKSHFRVLSIGVMDGDNSRGFVDYDETAYASYEEFCSVHPPGKAKHHCFQEVDLIPNYKWISQLYCLSASVYTDEYLWQPILEQFQEKGVRGYDIVLENELASRGTNIGLIVGCEAIHVGLEDGYLGGPWMKADTITGSVVGLKGG